MKCRSPFWPVVLSALVLAIGFGVGTAEPAQSSAAAQVPATDGHQPPAPSQSATAAQAVAPARPGATAVRPAPVWQGSQINGLSRRAERYYQGVWGVGELRVKVAESGQLIRFNYRVLDPEKAVALNDKKAEPELLDAQARVKLSVPQLEKVGKLRQSSSPKAGMTYWMAFSNPTLAVKRGHHVNLVIGSFQATNLLVE